MYETIDLQTYVRAIRSTVNDEALPGLPAGGLVPVSTRYNNQQYCDAINLGLTEGYRLRPDFRRDLGSKLVFVTMATPDALLAAVPWPAEYYMPLVLFASGMLELDDSEGNEDSRSAALLAAFTSKLTKPGV